MTFEFTCTCGVPDLEVEIEIDSSGSLGSYWEPGEGAEWHVETPCTCLDDPGPPGGEPIKGCGKVWDDEAIYERFGDEMQQRIADYYADREEDYYDDF